MVRWTWMAAWGLLAATAAMAALMAGSVCALAQAQSAPATGPAPFVQPVPEPVVPATRPAPAPFIQPLPEPAIGSAAEPPTTKPARPFISPTTEPTTGPASQPATSPASQPATSPAGGAVTQPADEAPKVDEQKTLGFSAWVAVEWGSQCVDLSKMPADVREFWQKHCTTRGRVLAERAARNAAIAQLAGRVGDLAIGPDLTVRKFLATTDRPDASAELFLRGATVWAVRYRADALVAEVEMEIRPRTLLASLKGWARSHVNVHRDPMTQLENALLQPGEATILPAPPMKEPATSTTAPVMTQPATQPTTREAAPAR